jgi:hypothetical protein
VRGFASKSVQYPLVLAHSFLFFKDFGIHISCIFTSHHQLDGCVALTDLIVGVLGAGLGQNCQIVCPNLSCSTSIQTKTSVYLSLSLSFSSFLMILGNELLFSMLEPVCLLCSATIVMKTL